jgi:hypothetical protein
MKITSRLQLVVCSSMVVLLCFVILVLSVSAQPSALPHSFYGAVMVTGQPAPIGVQVEVRGTGVHLIHIR